MLVVKVDRDERTGKRSLDYQPDLIEVKKILIRIAIGFKTYDHLPVGSWPPELVNKDKDYTRNVIGNHDTVGEEIRKNT